MLFIIKKIIVIEIRVKTVLLRNYAHALTFFVGINNFAHNFLLYHHVISSRNSIALRPLNLPHIPHFRQWGDEDLYICTLY